MIEFQSWIGLTVAILTILVTILIGWQVYNAIEMRNTLYEMRNVSEKINRKIRILHQRDDECRMLTEAYFLMYLSEQESSFPAFQYGRLGQTLLFFLKSKVNADYHSLFTVCARMDSTLEKIEKGTQSEKLFLAEKYFPYEILSKAINEELLKDKERYASIATKINNLKSKRKAIIKEIKDFEPNRYAEYADDIIAPFIYKVYT